MGYWTAKPLRAWRCDDCTRLTFRLDSEPDPPCCDACAGRLEPFDLRRPS